MGNATVNKPSERGGNYPRPRAALIAVSLDPA
jgi:hypothetical protein